jgi:hypothetical protein
MVAFCGVDSLCGLDNDLIYTTFSILHSKLVLVLDNPKPLDAIPLAECRCFFHAVGIVLQ